MNMQGYMFELITGPMSCGKTEELLRRIRRAIIAQKKVKVISPETDTRAKGDYIESRNGLWLDAIKVKNAAQILSAVKEGDELVAIDELQFFDEYIVKVIAKLLESGKKIIGAGLDLDFKSEPFGYMPELMCLATKIDKLSAVCMKCGNEYATRTQRLIDGCPVDKNSPLIMIGGNETYEARCVKCYELPDCKSETRKREFKLLQFGG
jgi:thymidine kinase